MTPEQKRRRIAEIEKDVQQIMHQLNHVEFMVDRNLVDRREIPLPFRDIPKLKMPSFLKTLWIGFTEELKTPRQEKDPR